MSGDIVVVSCPPYPFRSLVSMATRPKLCDRRACVGDTAPLAASILPIDTKTGRLPSPASLNCGVPVKFASTVPGCERSYDPSVERWRSHFPKFDDQWSEARQLCGASYDGLIAETAGA